MQVSDWKVGEFSAQNILILRQNYSISTRCLCLKAICDCPEKCTACLLQYSRDDKSLEGEKPVTEVRGQIQSQDALWHEPQGKLPCVFFFLSLSPASVSPYKLTLVSAQWVHTVAHTIDTHTQWTSTKRCIEQFLRIKSAATLISLYCVFKCYSIFLCYLCGSGPLCAQSWTHQIKALIFSSAGYWNKSKEALFHQYHISNLWHWPTFSFGIYFTGGSETCLTLVV